MRPVSALSSCAPMLELADRRDLEVAEKVGGGLLALD